MDKFLPLKTCMNIHEQHLLAHFPSSGSNAQSRVSVLCISLCGKAFLPHRFVWCKEAQSSDGSSLLQFDCSIPVAAITYSRNIKSSHSAELQLAQFILAHLGFASLKTVNSLHQEEKMVLEGN